MRAGAWSPGCRPCEIQGGDRNPTPTKFPVTCTGDGWASEASGAQEGRPLLRLTLQMRLLSGKRQHRFSATCGHEARARFLYSKW